MIFYYIAIIYMLVYLARPTIIYDITDFLNYMAWAYQNWKNKK